MGKRTVYPFDLVAKWDISHFYYLVLLGATHVTFIDAFVSEPEW